jgi:hypothetical protein
MKNLHPEEKKDFKAIILIAGALIVAQVTAFIIVVNQ